MKDLQAALNQQALNSNAVMRIISEKDAIIESLLKEIEMLKADRASDKPSESK